MSDHTRGLFRLGWVFLAARAFLKLQQVGAALIAVRRLLTVVTLRLQLHMGSVVVAPGFWSTGSVVVLQHVACPQIRDQAGISCTGRRFIYH